ncbi:unannotated protein [freshwater metagenome]|uniref:Unannotated protein n=1 Tax=freshwater metagenome TaxID=449393 RepID=A0A6J7LA77_9ZZZZ|nr:dimethyladenosine transferase [Actinomycetota bacterium]MSW49027.1 dimethyladenosine transferase [Actinomycetota bacterium]
MAIDRKNQIVSVDRVIPATPEQIFDLLADPRNHSAFDGSGTVKAANISAPTRLSLGAKFGMNMKMGPSYKIENEVVEFVEARQIAWRHQGHHVWRYILEPVAGGTKVTEQFDYSKMRAKIVLYVLQSIPKNEKSIIKTLENLEKYFASK